MTHINRLLACTFPAAQTWRPSAIPDPFEGLKWDVTPHSSGADIPLPTRSQANFDDDQYPVEADMRIVARFNDVPMWVIEKRITASDPGPRPPRKPPLLTDPPTFLQGYIDTSAALGKWPYTHVRLRWNEKIVSHWIAAAWTFIGGVLLFCLPASHVQ